MSEERSLRGGSAATDLVVPIGVVVAVAVICVIVAVLTSAHGPTKFRSTASSNCPRGRLPQSRRTDFARGRGVAATDRGPLRDPHRLRPAMGGAQHRQPGCRTLLRPRRRCRGRWFRQIKYKFFRSPGDPAVVRPARSLRQVSICCAGGSLRCRAAPLRSSAKIPASTGRRTALIQQFARPAGDRRGSGGRHRGRSRARQRPGAHRVFRQIYRREHVARDQQPAAAAGPAPDRRSGTGRRAAGRRTSPTRRGRHNAPGVDADPSWRRDHGQRPAVHCRGGRRLRAACRPDDPLYAAGDGKRSSPAKTQLRHLALHDPVCGLPNRIYFGERLESVIAEVRHGGPSAAVFYIDLDHFKDVNDTLGHHVGDALILNVTQRLSGVVRGHDLVARLAATSSPSSPPAPPTRIRCRRSPAASSPPSARPIRSTATTSSSAPRSASP